MVPVSPPPSEFPSPLPYREASDWQLRQAAFSAGQLLEPAFPYLTRADWQRALEAIQPALYVLADQVLLTYDGLAQVTHHVATAMPAARPLSISPTQFSSGSRKGSGRGKQPAPAKELDAALLEQLRNVSYWRALPFSQAIEEVLIQGLRHFPEAQRPRTPEGPF